MNYTKPNESNHEDKPSDWLNSALIFARALSLMLKESEGVIVDIVGDMEMQDEPTVKKVIVYNESGMIHIMPFNENTDEGAMTWMHTHSEN
jgi:hypothetical protein